MAVGLVAVFTSSGVLLGLGGCGDVAPVLAFSVQVGKQVLCIGPEQPVHVHLHTVALPIIVAVKCNFWVLGVYLLGI